MSKTAKMAKWPQKVKTRQREREREREGGGGGEGGRCSVLRVTFRVIHV